MDDFYESDFYQKDSRDVIIAILTERIKRLEYDLYLEESARKSYENLYKLLDDKFTQYRIDNPKKD